MGKKPTYKELEQRIKGLEAKALESRQEIDFILHVQDVVIPVECKTGRLRSNDTRLIRSLAEKWGAPFSVMVTSDTFDFSDPSILRVPAFML